MKRTLALLVLTLVCGAASVNASVLQGQVVEVHDGRTVTVENTGRRIKVALKAAEAPERDQLSVRMPQGGFRYTTELQVPDGLPINADFYWVRHLKIAYLAVWASGPYCPETIPTIFDRLTEALNEAAAAESLPCEFYQLKAPSMNGYVGRLYKVRDCYFKGGIRHYYKIEGKKLTVVGVGVMSEIPDNPEIGRFLDSFEIKKKANQ